MSTTALVLGWVPAAMASVIGPVWVARITQQAKAETSEAKKSIEAKLGTPNGHGDVSTMLSTLIHQQAQLLDGQTGQDTRLAVIESRLGKGDERMAGLGGRLSDMADQVDELAGKLAPLIDGQAALVARVGKIESSCSYIAAHVEEAPDGS